MKILYVTTISNTVNAFLIPHIKMLVDEGHQVDVAFNIEQKVKSEIIELGCKIYQIPFQRSPIKKENIIASKMLKDIIISNKYDLVHTHTPVASAIVRLVCRKLMNIKVLYTAHGFHFFYGAPFKNWLFYYPIEKFLSKYTDVLITINDDDFNTSIVKNFKAKKIVKVNGVGIDFTKFLVPNEDKKYRLREEYSFSNKDFILIYVGELSSRKNQKILIEAISYSYKEIPNLKLLLVGEGELKYKYEKLIENMGVSDYVKVLGYRSDIPELMQLSDASVSSSKHEGLPVNVIEAMATGLPLIVSDCRGNKDLVENDFNGYLIEANNERQMSEMIISLYKNREKREQFKENSLKILSKYSIDSVLKEMNQIYSEIKL